ncbi:MAG: type II toxin-antitoxin system VapC family toxin [Aestuariivirga sp.]
MLAIDTSVVVRYLARDDPKQSRKARELIDRRPVFVATTVLLETEWVLRGVYKLGPQDAARALTAFAGLPNVNLEDAGLAAKALDWALQGMDFADALHLARAAACAAFLTFDRRFVAAAGKLADIEVRMP